MILGTYGSRLRAQGSRLGAWLRRGGALFSGLLDELSDQSAYARHLKLEGRRHSPAEWRRFSDARLKAKFGRPKCC